MRERSSSNPNGLKIYKEGYCPWCAVRFRYDKRWTKYCSQKCQWAFNGRIQRKRKLLKYVELNIPISPEWLLWAKITLAGYVSKGSDRHIIYDTLAELTIEEKIDGLCTLNYPPLLEADSDVIFQKRFAIILLHSDDLLGPNIANIRGIIET